MRKVDQALQKLKEFSESWDFYDGSELKQKVILGISNAINSHFENNKFNFDEEIKNLKKALDNNSDSISEVLSGLSPYTLEFLRSRPDWNEGWMMDKKNSSENKKRMELIQFFAFKSKRLGPHKDKKWDRFKKSETRLFDASGGAPGNYEDSDIIFCNSICMAHSIGNGLVPKKIGQVDNGEYRDLLNLIQDCFEIIKPETGIDPEKILKATVRRRVKYMNKFNNLSA